MDFNQSVIKLIDYSGQTKEQDLRQILTWRSKLAGKRIIKLIYNFVSRENIVQINKDYLKHDYATDIITFDYGNHGFIEGEIFVCPDVVFDNAKDLKQKPGVELDRVIFHGLLHLIGFNDATILEKEEMRKEEDRCLAKLMEVDNV